MQFKYKSMKKFGELDFIELRGIGDPGIFQMQNWEILHGVRGIRKDARHCALTDKTGISIGRKILCPYRHIDCPKL